MNLYLPRPSQAHKFPSSNKNKNLIVLYSPIASNISDVLNVVKGLAGLSNGILQINEVKRDVLANGNEEIVIEYEVQRVARVKRIEVIVLSELNK